MTKPMWRTFWICVAAGIGLVGYDVWTAYQDGAASTISWVILYATQRNPILGVGLGVLIGHLFASQRQVGLSSEQEAAPEMVALLEEIDEAYHDINSGKCFILALDKIPVVLAKAGKGGR